MEHKYAYFPADTVIPEGAFSIEWDFERQVSEGVFQAYKGVEDADFDESKVSLAESLGGVVMNHEEFLTWLNG